MMLNLCRLLLIMSFIIGTNIPVKAHSSPSGWDYHPDCCSDKDCYPVEVKPFGNGMLEFKTKSGVLILNVEQYRDKMLPSQDQDYHICINGGRVLCIYVPAGI